MPSPDGSPGVETPDTTRKVAFLKAMVRTMLVLCALGILISLGDQANQVGTTLAFFGSAAVWLLAISLLVRRGRVVLAAWSISLFFWAMIAFVTLFFGGMQGSNAACFGVSVLLVGSVVGARAALVIAVASSAWCAGVVWLELHGALPAPLGPYSPVNAWSAVTITLILTGVLLNNSLASLARAAQERDAALRRSIHAQKMELVGTLSSGIAHDFNNLLTVMVAAAAELRQRVGSTPQNLAPLEDLEAATSRAAQLTRRLLAFGRTSDDALAPVDLGALVQSAGAMLPRLLGTQVRVEVEAQPGCVVNASAGGLEQIVLNLAVNARDAMPQGGTLLLRVRGVGDEVVLEARDTGHGMDETTRARVFEPFFTTKTTGTGLGLATVREMMARFGGTIHLETAPNVGTTFVLRFRKVATAPAAATVNSPPNAPVPSTQRRRILLVEDDLLVRRSTARLLEHEGYDVTAVGDGMEALAVVETAPDLVCVVTDVVMPRMDGETLANTLAQRRPTLPVLLMSGNRTPGPDVLRAPGRAFVEKPVDRASLCAQLEALIGASTAVRPPAPLPSV